MNGDTPVTKSELQVALTEFEERLLARIEKSEANLLTAFRSWARRSDTRQKVTTTLVNSFDERLGDLEDQVAEIRDRLK